MTSALQHAADLVANEQPAPEIVCTVAGPRRPISSQIYTGAELRPTSVRPGAYDAMALPSLFNGRKHAPGTLARHVAVEWVAPPPAAPAASVLQSATPTPGRRARNVGELRVLQQGRVGRTDYVPHAGSGPARLIERLQRVGGHMTYAQIAAEFAIPPSHLTAIFKSALLKQALVRHVINRQAALALPGYVPPPDDPAPAPAPANPPTASRELKKLTDQLAKHLRQATALLDAIQKTEHRIAELQSTPE